MSPSALPSSLIALYHAVGSPAESGYRDALSLARLEQQLRWLKRHYHVVTLGELSLRAAAGRSLAGLAALTFDDNHRSLLQCLPLLIELHLPATWFLIGAPLHGAPFWRHRIRALEKNGRVADFIAFARDREAGAAGLQVASFYRDSKNPRLVPSPRIMGLLDEYLGPEAAPPDFLCPSDLVGVLPLGLCLGNHTLTHPVMAGLSEAEQRAEIAGGREALAGLGHPLDASLALPFGDPDSYDSVTLRVARELGCSAVLATAPGLAECQPDEGRLAPLPLFRRSLLGRLREVPAGT